MRIQAVVENKPIASAHISALMKDVTEGMSGGDFSRKRKLIDKQIKGKLRMKVFGKVKVPQEAFMAVMQVNRPSSIGHGT